MSHVKSALVAFVTTAVCLAIVYRVPQVRDLVIPTPKAA